MKYSSAIKDLHQFQTDQESRADTTSVEDLKLVGIDLYSKTFDKEKREENVKVVSFDDIDFGLSPGTKWIKCTETCI